MPLKVVSSTSPNKDFLYNSLETSTVIGHVCFIRKATSMCFHVSRYCFYSKCSYKFTQLRLRINPLFSYLQKYVFKFRTFHSFVEHEMVDYGSVSYKWIIMEYLLLLKYNNIGLLMSIDMFCWLRMFIYMQSVNNHVTYSKLYTSKQLYLYNLQDDSLNAD